MRKLLIFSLILFSIKSYSQLRWTEKQIIHLKGKADTAYTDISKNTYLSYKTQYADKKEIITTVTLYVLNFDDTCRAIILSEPENHYIDWKELCDTTYEETGVKDMWYDKPDDVYISLEHNGDGIVAINFFTENFAKKLARW
jgi:hypothetical protein